MTIEAQDTEFEATARKAYVKLLISIEVNLCKIAFYQDCIKKRQVFQFEYFLYTCFDYTTFV